MPLPARFCRVIVRGGSGVARGGFEVDVRHDPGEARVDSPVFARLACDDVNSVNDTLHALQVDGVSRFVRETTWGPVFEYLPLDPGQLMSLVEGLGRSGTKSITFIASDVSETETALRIEAAMLIPAVPASH